MINTRLLRKAKATVLTAFVTGGMLLGWSCGWSDLRYNFVAGTQAFVKGYTTDLWEAVFPAPEDLINFGAEE
ncbi:MAG: hypothetical protein JSU63_16175 [Phycisphaerales bacterium]|nr:MAG: hypothetical protein JSU63_16175 [Phycisphaerales bacterium]